MLRPNNITVPSPENMVIAQIPFSIIYEDEMFPVGVREGEPEFVAGNIDLMPALLAARELCEKHPKPHNLGEL